jgi:hypothetical protein
MRLVFSLLALFCSAIEIPGYDSETSNYGDFHKSAETYKKESGNAVDPDKELFYFFSLHDYNRDHHLDGHELSLAYMGYEFYKEEQIHDVIRKEDMEFMIDHALMEDDKDNDGKISWSEYLESQNYHHQLK